MGDEDGGMTYGVALIEREMLLSLTNVWEAQEEKQDLIACEKALRALMLSKSLVPTPDASSLAEKNSGLYVPYESYEQPFEDHLLEYEFLQADVEFSIPKILGAQKNALSDTVTEAMKVVFSEVLRAEGSFRWSGKNSTGEFIEYDEEKYLRKHILPARASVAGFTSEEIVREFWAYVGRNSSLSGATYGEYQESKHIADFDYM